MTLPVLVLYLNGTPLIRLVGERAAFQGRAVGGGVDVFIYTYEYTSFDHGQVLRVIIQYPERCYGTKPDAR